MLCETLVKTTKEDLSLSVSVCATSLAMPRSEEELKDELLAHALDCHECLAAVLFEEGSLSDCGCDVYRDLFAAATEELERSRPVDPETHLSDDLMESFFFDQLSDQQLSGMAEHVENCVPCREKLRDRQNFYVCVKTAVQDQKNGRAEGQSVAGVVGVNAPDLGMNYCFRLSEQVS